jgi:hypothetical protein
VIQVFTVLALLAGYAFFLLARPVKRCRPCAGWGAKGRRRAYCVRCQGTGRRFRPGARLLHRAAAEAYRYIRTRRERSTS